MAPIPLNEEKRLVALDRYQILDTDPEQAYDDITFLASEICKTKLASITFIDRNRQWFKSRLGMFTRETPREFAFCAHGILQPEVMIVEDASIDVRFAANPFVTGDPHIRFYAGAPLITLDGHALGMLCAIDTVARTFSRRQSSALQALARQVVAQLELRRTTMELSFTRMAALETVRKTGSFSLSYKLNRILSKLPYPGEQRYLFSKRAHV